MNRLVLMFCLSILAGLLPLAGRLPLVFADERYDVRDAILTEERSFLETERKQGYLSRNLDKILDKQHEAMQRVEAARAKKRELHGRIESLQNDQAVLRQELAAVRQSAGTRLALLSRMSSAGPLEILLTARHPADFVYRYHALQAVNEADRELLEKVRFAEDKLARVQLAMDVQLQELSSLEDEANAELERVTVLASLRKEEIGKLADELDERRVFLERMKKQAAELGALVGSGNGSSSAVVTEGRLRPIPRAKLLASYGQPDPAMGNIIDIKGWRFSAPPGVTVSTVASGTVGFSGWFQGFGNLVVVEHGGGYTSLYAHLDERLVGAGDEIIAGEPVGKTGGTGSVLQSGLYFELRRDGQAVDPVSWKVRQPEPADR